MNPSDAKHTPPCLLPLHLHGAVAFCAFSNSSSTPHTPRHQSTLICMRVVMVGDYTSDDIEASRVPADLAIDLKIVPYDSFNVIPEKEMRIHLFFHLEESLPKASIAPPLQQTH